MSNSIRRRFIWGLAILLIVAASLTSGVGTVRADHYSGWHTDGCFYIHVYDWFAYCPNSGWWVWYFGSWYQSWEDPTRTIIPGYYCPNGFCIYP